MAFHHLEPSGRLKEDNLNRKLTELERILSQLKTESPQQEERERKFKFLLSFDPEPLSNEFRGDVRLLGSDNVTIYAHRFILSSRSPVFKKMFEADMKEKKTRMVELRDFDSASLRAMVNFCYVGEIVFCDSVVPELIVSLAHKCDIPYLKLCAERELCKDVTVHNVSEKLVLASIFDLKLLDEEASNFVRENFEQGFVAVKASLSKWGQKQVLWNLRRFRENKSGK